jgi:hypothetical protein
MADEGRPAVGPLRQVCVRIDPALHDEACRRALAESLSVSQVCRRAIRVGLSQMYRRRPLPLRPTSGGSK